MNTKTYEATCNLTKNIDNLSPVDLRSYLCVGLSGEVGETLNILKKDLFYPGYEISEEELLGELGDCLYYLTNLITDCGFDLETVMKANALKVKKILVKKLEGK